MNPFSAIFCLLIFAQPVFMATEEHDTGLDLNKTPPPSSHSESGDRLMDSASSQLRLIPSEENSVVKHLSKGIGATKQNQNPKKETKRRKRQPSREYKFPPGTTRKERLRVYRNVSYASMVSSLNLTVFPFC